LTRVVFFDWFNTLAQYTPPREELQSQALREFGINVSPQEILPGILIADINLFEEIATSPLRQKSPAEKAEIYGRYQQTVLNETGTDSPDDSDFLMKLLKRLQEMSKDLRFSLFDDVLPVIKSLSKKSLILGILTNMDTDMRPICRELGLEDFLDLIVTSNEVGFDKPQPEIFLAAAKQAGVDVSEAVHVGDHHIIDAAGAKAVGIKPVLIDRYNLYPEITDYPRISGLFELSEYL